jgi:hypothetical protein
VNRIPDEGSTLAGAVARRGGHCMIDAYVEGNIWGVTGASREPITRLKIPKTCSTHSADMSNEPPLHRFIVCGKRVPGQPRPKWTLLNYLIDVKEATKVDVWWCDKDGNRIGPVYTVDPREQKRMVCKGPKRKRVGN